MKNCCIKFSDKKKLTPKKIHELKQNTENFIKNSAKISLDDLAGMDFEVIIPDVSNEVWVVNLSKFHQEMIRIKREAERSIGILSVGLSTFICTQPLYGCTTACVGGGELLFYIPFLLSLKSKEVIFVYAHELYHTYQNIPTRIMTWAYKNVKQLRTDKDGHSKEPNASELNAWYADNHGLINRAADYEDNFNLKTTGIVDEKFLIGGDASAPRFCYKESYGRMPFENIFAELYSGKMTGFDEASYKPRKKVVFEDPVIIEDADDDNNTKNHPTLPDGNGMEFEKHIHGEQTIKVSDEQSPEDDGTDVVFKDGYEDRRKNKKDDNSEDGDGKGSDKSSDNGERSSNDSDSNSEGSSKGSGEGSDKNSDDTNDGGSSEGSDEKSDGSDEGSDENNGRSIDGDGSSDGSDENSDGMSGGGSSGGSDENNGRSIDGGGDKSLGGAESDDIEEAKKEARAIVEWAANRTGVSVWKGGRFTGELKGSLTPKEMSRIMKQITSSSLSSKSIHKIEDSLRNGVETIISTIKKSARWGNRNHVWKKEIRPYSKITKEDAMINMILLFDNSGSMGAPLICSCVDCILNIWADYENIISKVVLIPMRDRFENDGNDYYIIDKLDKAQSAKNKIVMKAGKDNHESFNTAIALLRDKQIIDPEEYNVFLNMGDRVWGGGTTTVKSLCETINNINKVQDLRMHDIFTSINFGANKDDTNKINDVFDRYKVNTINQSKRR